MNDCQVCCETFNLQSHKKVTCSFCDYKLCRKCVQTYTLTTVNDPHCVNCKHTWDREFLDQSCTKVFINKELKEHRETILFEREKSFFPETQDAARREKQVRNIRKLIIDARNEIEKQRDLIMALERNLSVLNNGANLNEEYTKAKIVRKCPIENCKGFLNSSWKCDLCETNICSKCNESKKDTHECDEKNVESFALIKKDSKSCPKCGIMIFKSGGCAQMWCTSCHCAFNWNTGRIEEGVIHNPHFYEFQRQNGTNLTANRNIGDIPCGGMPSLTELNTFCGLSHRITNRYYNHQYINTTNLTSDENIIYNVHRMINHLVNYEFLYVLTEDRLILNNRDLRIQFLLNELSEENFKKQIQQREKKNQKVRDVIAVLRMFTITGSDMLRQLVLKDILTDTFCSNIVKLKDYTNENLKKISKRYSSSHCKYITSTWEYL